MKTNILLLALLPCLLYSADSFADPFAPAQKRASELPSTMIEVTTEWLQVSEADATALLHDDKPPTNSLEWRQKLNSLLKDGKARVAASASVVTQEGQTGKSNSEMESHYLTSQTEFERTESAANSGFESEGPVTRIKTQSDYETADHGISMEVDPSIKEAGVIHLNYSLEWSSMAKSGSNQRAPEVYRIRDNGSVTIRAGGTLMVGVSTPRGEEGGLDTTQRLLSFISVRLIQP